MTSNLCSRLHGSVATANKVGDGGAGRARAGLKAAATRPRPSHITRRAGHPGIVRENYWPWRISEMKSAKRVSTSARVRGSVPWRLME